MVRFPPIRVCLRLQDDVTCYGILFKRVFVVGSVNSGQIWVKFDDNLGMEDKWILDASIVSVQIVAREQGDLTHLTGCLPHET